jgi:transcriptional regulator with XRE-family HTH domain
MKHDLKKQRKELKIKQTEIALEFGVSRSAVHYWEKRKEYPNEVKQWMDKQMEGEYNVSDRLRMMEKRMAKLEKKLEEKEQ